jgi:hypothetical protein
VKYRSDEAALRARRDELTEQLEALDRELGGLDPEYEAAEAKRVQAEKAVALSRGKIWAVRVVAGAFGVFVGTLPWTAAPLILRLTTSPTPCFELEVVGHADRQCAIVIRGRANAGACVAEVACPGLTNYTATGTCARSSRGVVFSSDESAPAGVLSTVHGEGVFVLHNETRTAKLPKEMTGREGEDACR